MAAVGFYISRYSLYHPAQDASIPTGPRVILYVEYPQLLGPEQFSVSNPGISCGTQTDLHKYTSLISSCLLRNGNLRLLFSNNMWLMLKQL